MARSGNTLIQSLRLLLMCSGILFIAILISISFPYSLLSSTSSQIPSLWFSIKSWLQPPYLYIIINAIIIIIAASSRLHRHHHAPPKHDVISIRSDQFSPYDAVSVTEIVDSAGSFYGAVSVKDVADVEIVGSVDPIEDPRSGLASVVEKEKEEEEDDVPEIRGVREESTAVETSTWTPAPLTRQKPVDISPEKPLVTSRFGHHIHRRPVKVKASTGEGGKALRVAKPKKHDTFESTWKTITEGRHVPLTRHLKKLDTWQYQSRQINLLDDPLPPSKPTKKSETFKDRTNQTSPPVTSSKLKKEPSLSQDELNRRVEAFINKFNEEMRLQRQQSMQQFLEKINRAA